MVDELYYEKNQLLMDKSGVIWVLLDIRESKSLLSKSSEPSLVAFVRKKESSSKGARPKIMKIQFQKFSSKFTPFLYKDKNTIAQVLSLENLLSEEVNHPPLLEDGL